MDVAGRGWEGLTLTAAERRELAVLLGHCRPLVADDDLHVAWPCIVGGPLRRRRRVVALGETTAYVFATEPERAAHPIELVETVPVDRLGTVEMPTGRFSLDGRSATVAAPHRHVAGAAVAAALLGDHAPQHA